MATPEEIRQRREAQRQRLLAAQRGLRESAQFAPISNPAADAISQASQQAGGGALGAGVAAREVVNQAVTQPLANLGRETIRAADVVAQPTGRFLQGLILGAPPEPTTQAPRRPGAPGTNFPDLLGVSQPQQATPAAAASPQASPPLLPGQTARTPSQAPSGGGRADPNFGFDNVPQGGGILLDQAGDVAARVLPGQGQEIARRANTVPSSFFTAPPSGTQSTTLPAVADSQGPRRSALLENRSRDFDALLRDLVEQSTRTPGSFDELFRRRGVRDALGQVAGVAQGAGSNLTQDITNLRDVLQRQRGDDLTAQSRAQDRAVTTRGQDLLFDRSVLGSLIGARNVDVQAETSRDVAQTQAEVTREQIAVRQELAKLAPELAFAADPQAQLQRMILAQQNFDGTPMTPEQVNNALALHNAIFGQQNLLQGLLQQ